MEYQIYIASDQPLPEYREPFDYTIYFNDTDWQPAEGTDDNYSIVPVHNISYLNISKPYVSMISCHDTPGRMRRIIGYIREVLENTDSIEIHAPGREFNQISKKYPPDFMPELRCDELTAEFMEALVSQEFWSEDDVLLSAPRFRIVK